MSLIGEKDWKLLHLLTEKTHLCW